MKNADHVQVEEETQDEDGGDARTIVTVLCRGHAAKGGGKVRA